MMGFRLLDTPMDLNAKFLPGQIETLSNLARYGQLVGKFNYLIVIRHDIFFLVSVLRQFMDSSYDGYCDAVVRIF